jgi:hypothetical protein
LHGHWELDASHGCADGGSRRLQGCHVRCHSGGFSSVPAQKVPGDCEVRERDAVAKGELCKVRLVPCRLLRVAKTMPLNTLLTEAGRRGCKNAKEKNRNQLLKFLRTCDHKQEDERYKKEKEERKLKRKREQEEEESEGEEGEEEEEEEVSE